MYNSVEVLALYDFLKLYFRMCSNIKKTMSLLDDEDEEEEWGYGYGDDMMAQFKQDFYNKTFTFQDQGKDDPINTLENRIILWLNITNFHEGPIPDNLYDYDYNNDGLDHSVHGAERSPDRRELKNFLDILRSK